MAIIEAVVLESERFRSARQITSHRFEIPSIPDKTISDEYSCFINVNEGKLLQCRVACQSGVYHFSVRGKAGVTIPSIDQILYIEDIDQSYDEMGLDILFSNNDNPESKKLYVVIDNQANDPTGIVLVEFILSRM